MRVLALLDQLADDRDAGRSQQLAELAEVLRRGLRCDAQSALPRASLARGPAVVRLDVAVAGAGHLVVPSEGSVVHPASEDRERQRHRQEAIAEPLLRPRTPPDDGLQPLGRG
jgi:hypothetical protein